MSDKNSIIPYEFKEPTNYVDRCNVIGKALNIKYWPMGYKGFNERDIWLLMESVFRIPICKSFLNDIEFKHYCDAVIRMINNTLIGYGSLVSDPNKKMPTTSTHPQDVIKQYRIYADAHREMMEIAQKKIKSEEKISYEEYTTEELRRAFEYLLYLKNRSNTYKKETDSVSEINRFVSNTGQYIRLDKPKMLDDLYLANDNAASNNSEILTGINQNINELCTVLTKREDHNNNETAEIYCISKKNLDNTENKAIIKANEYYNRENNE